MEEPRLEDLKLDFDLLLSNEEQRRLADLDVQLLLDIQTRHAAKLFAAGLIWRANIQATEFDIHDPSKPLLDEQVMHRACIFRKNGYKDKQILVEQAGIRFITNRCIEQPLFSGKTTTEIVHDIFDVPVYTEVSGSRRACMPFKSEDADLIASLIPELEAVREELHLSGDLTMIIHSDM